MVLLPEIKYIRIDDIILVFLAIYYLKHRIANSISKEIYLVLLLLVVNISLSTISYMTFIHADSDLTALIKEVIRILKAFAIVIVSYGIVKPAQNEEYIENTLFLSTVVCVIIAVLQYYDIADINNYIQMYYKPDNIQYYNSSRIMQQLGYFRATSTFYNPNILGAFLLIPYSINIANMMEKLTIRHSAMIIVVLIGIILTQSRSALFIIAIITVFSIIKTRKLGVKAINQRRKKIMILIVIVLLSYTIVQTFNFVRIFMSNIEVLQYSRVSAYSTFLELLTDYPILGKSPFAFKEYPFDSEYLLILYNFGVFGLAIYFYAVLNVFRRIRNIDDTRTLILSNLLLIVPLTGLSNGFVFSNRIFPIFLIIFISIYRKVYDSQ